jgi:regulator of CtrA degradation
LAVRLWQQFAMHAQGTARIHRKLVDSLYVEAMLLADEARAYFDEIGRNERDALAALNRVAFSCESLKVTTRLMHVIAWLLTQRAVDAGELEMDDALAPSRRLGPAPETDASVLEAMPAQALSIIMASMELYRRVARLDSSFDLPDASGSPARRMMERLAGAF